jgi:hypothetical protein
MCVGSESRYRRGAAATSYGLIKGVPPPHLISHGGITFTFCFLILIIDSVRVIKFHINQVKRHPIMGAFFCFRVGHVSDILKWTDDMCICGVEGMCGSNSGSARW